jgi:protocatechuate 3,4-dioxygenase beta subunit
MKIVFRVSVKGGAASAEKMPVISEGSRGVVYLAAAFDEEWQNIPVKKLTLWREGETMLQFLLDDTGELLLPEVFTLSEKPFYLRFAGEDGDFSLQTNSLCASFGELRAPAEDQPSFTVYTGNYTLTENGVYPMENKVLTEDLTVDVFTVDTTKDTVTPETLHQGVTAHDAAGNLIEGTYVNPYNANTEGDTVTPEALHQGITAHDAAGNPIEGTYVNPYNANTEGDTVTPEALHKGVTAHDAAGKPIEGIYVNPYNANTEGDTVTPETLHQGITAHDAAGNPIEGTYVPKTGGSLVSSAGKIIYGAYVSAGACECVVVKK